MNKKIDTMEAQFAYSNRKRKWFLNWKFPFLHYYWLIENAELLSVSPKQEDLERILGTKYKITIGQDIGALKNE